MATLREKIDAERKMRALIDANGLPEPDEVEYGDTCIRLFWRETKTAVIVDIDELPDDEADDAARPEDALLADFDVDRRPPTAGGGS